MMKRRNVLCEMNKAINFNLDGIKRKSLRLNSTVAQIVPDSALHELLM